MLTFLLFFIHFVHANTLPNKKNLFLLPKKTPLSKLKPQWYYVHYSSSKDIHNIKSTLKNIKIDSTSFSGDTIILYLSPKEVQSINSLPNIKIYTKSIPKTPLSTRISTKNESYIIFAHQSFQPSKYTQTTSHSGPYYFISTNQPWIFESDPSVLSIQKVPKFELQNRWAAGFTQSGNEKEVLRNDFYASDRLYNDRGLNGSNVIVTLIDSGLDLENCLFKDEKQPVPFNKTNFNHRKVVRYDPFADNIDKYVGHGTHCGGTIAGQVDDFPISLYNGNAPAAKLYVADIGKDERDNMVIDSSYILEIVEQAKELKSPILSCSWGFDGINIEITAVYDYLGYINKEMLFVFAAGNYEDHYTVSPPSDSRNVLTVAASVYPKSGCLEETASGPIKISSNGDVLNANAENRFESLRTNPISYLNDLDVVYLDENLDFEEYSIYKNKVVILPNKPNFYYDDPIGYLENNGAKAVIHYEDFYINFQFTIMIISASSKDDSFFKTHKKINITVINENCPNGNPEVAPFSSKGPSILGRRKPDVMAPGTLVWSAATIFVNEKCEFYNVLRTMSGTSMATPAVSGAMALVYQYLKESIHQLPIDNSKPITSALLRAFAVAAASGVGEDTESGFGSIKLNQILIYPKLDSGRGLRFCSDQIKDNEAHSYFIRTDSVGTFSASIAWIDLPMSPESTLPLYSYFELFVIGPNGVVYDSNEQFSTTKKIVIQNAPVGEYEVRIHVREVMHSDENIDYSIVIVGAFDHLKFEQNPGELQKSIPKECLSKCPIDKGHAKCQSETTNCICDSRHTGPNCEFEIEEFADQKQIKRSLQVREFWYTKIDYSKYKERLDINDLENVAFQITAQCSLPTNESFGMIRFFTNTDNELPLSIPRYSVQVLEVQKGQYEDTASFTFEIPLDEMNERSETYLTVFNDIITEVSLSLEWKLRGTIIPDGNMSKKFFENEKLWIILIAVLAAAVVALLILAIVFGIIAFRKKKLNNDYSKNNRMNESLVDSI